MSAWVPTIHATDNERTVRQKKYRIAEREWALSRGATFSENGALRSNNSFTYHDRKAFQDQWSRDYDAHLRGQKAKEEAARRAAEAARQRAEVEAKARREAEQRRHQQEMQRERQQQAKVMQTNTSQVPSAGGREWNTWLENSRSPAPKIGLDDDWAKSDKSAFQGVIDAGDKGFSAVAGDAAPGIPKPPGQSSDEANRWEDDSFGPDPGDGFDLTRFTSSPMGLGDGKAVATNYANKFKSRFY